jgi:hypothetical protein
VSTRDERKRQVGKAINDGMAAATGADWTRTTAEISAAEAHLNEAMADYVDGTTSISNVRDVYQRWRDLHKVGAKA